MSILLCFFICFFSLLNVTTATQISVNDSSNVVAILQDTIYNPKSSPPTFVEFELFQKDTITIIIFNTKGKPIKQIFKGVLSPKKYKFIVVTPDMVTGVYYVLVKGRKEILKKRIIVLK